MPAPMFLAIYSPPVFFPCFVLLMVFPFDIRGADQLSGEREKEKGRGKIQFVNKSEMGLIKEQCFFEDFVFVNSF